MLTQPAPASAGDETEEDQHFRTIFQQIAGDVSTREPEKAGGTESMVLEGGGGATDKKLETLVIIFTLKMSAICLLFSLIIQEMEISANELRNVLFRVLAESMYISMIIITYGYMHSFIYKTTFTFSTFTDKDMNKEGFSLESCRSMIAFMDVSFGKRSVHAACAREFTFC